MIVDSAVYTSGQRLGAPADLDGALSLLEENPEAFCWIGLHDPDPAELERIATAFGLHELAVEDATSHRQRPKLERYSDMLFAVLTTLWHDEKTRRVQVGQVSVFVGERYVVTVRLGAGGDLRATRSDLEERAAVLGHGPAAVLYAICDRVVDDYGVVADELELRAEEAEQSVFSPDRTSDAETIYRLKRDLLRVRRATEPIVEPLKRLATGQIRQIAPDSAPFFRDVWDHSARVAEHVESLDDLSTSTLSAHLARVGVQQNEDMRKISVIAAMFAVPTLIAGIYGMNFDHMPETHWLLGYPAAVLLMVVVCALLWRGFRRAGWI